METLPHTHGCFVCGDSNPVGLGLRFVWDGTTVRTRFTPTPEHAGFRDVVHGGILATVLDEIMVWGCAVQAGRFAYCAELAVRFRHPARPGEELAVSAEMVSNRRDRLFEARAEIRNPGGELLASGAGKYLAVSDEDAARMLADFVGSPEMVQRWRPGGG